MVIKLSNFISIPIISFPSQASIVLSIPLCSYHYLFIYFTSTSYQKIYISKHRFISEQQPVTPKEQLSMGKGINGYIKRTFSKLNNGKIKMENKTIGKGKSGKQDPKTKTKAKTKPDTQSNHKDGTVKDVAQYDTENFVFENFNAIYVQGEENNQGWSSGTPEYEYTDDLPRNLRSSHRFFAGPVLSDSLMEEARLSVSTTATQVGSNNSRMAMTVDSVAEITYSSDPYEDFRQSMVDMLHARHGCDDNPSEPLDWDFIEQLLFCYLKLNDKKVHTYIFRAFGDLTEKGRQMLRVD